MYQVLARKYRPQTFKEILGQDPIVRTLQNAIRHDRLAHAYLFSGPRGTGKTTIARIFAKALNCKNLNNNTEPCNTCPSCREITAGHSLDVLEIDGASHRGIEDIRQINETAGYAASSGGYKIYIIDEVHMLTKEAFNALLKTLEEPPENVKFFFATTEPHKVLPTIISRCQRYQLNRISNLTIMNKLKEIGGDLGVDVEEEAYKMIANLSEGGLRDAESLFDQVLAFQEGAVTAETISSILGLATIQIYFDLDEAANTGDIAKAFEIVDGIFSHGKDLSHFLGGMVDHFRNHLLILTSGAESPYLQLTENEKGKYRSLNGCYTKEQCITILEMLLETQQTLRTSPSPKTLLESNLIAIIRIKQRIPIEFLIKKLTELEGKAPEKMNSSSINSDPTPELNEIPPARPKPASPKKSKPVEKNGEPPGKKAEPPKTPKASEPKKEVKRFSVNEQSRHDTVMQFASIELEGTLKKP